MIEDHPMALYSPYRVRLFRLWLRGLFWRRFEAVRLARTDRPDIASGPVVVFCNHPSWWDPAMLFFLAGRVFPGWACFGPMDAGQLERYRLFRRMGLFAIEPNARGARRFLAICRDLLARSDSVIGITAQGRFADVRERPVALARGLAHLARAAPHAAFIPLALDYPFWNTERPEALARFGPRVQVAVGETVRSTASRFETALEGVMTALARDAIGRDPAPFEALLARR